MKDYRTPEVVLIGGAEHLLLGTKMGNGPDDNCRQPEVDEFDQ